MAPEHHIRIDGTLKPRSKFLGNSAASMMEGIAILRLLNRGNGPKGERYILTQPNMYARGILFGKMKYELGDHSFVRCPELGLSADIEFKTKGYFGGTYNAIGGSIKDDKTGEVLYEISGMWSGEMFLKDMKVCFEICNVAVLIMCNRPDRERCYSMPRRHLILLHLPDHWKNKMNASLRGYGTRRLKRLLHETTNLRRMRRARLRIGKETRLLREQKMELSGIQNSLDQFKVVQVAQKKERKDSISF